MPEIPKGVPYLDLLVPAGASQHAQELETRVALMNLGSWRFVADDGTMERGSPMQPLRGDLERLQVIRAQPLFAGESMDVAANLLVELTLTCGAHLGALGVGGTFAWGMVLAEDVRWLHGLVLLDWLYNPRISALGELLEDPKGPAVAAEMQAKMAVYSRLWTPERSAAFARRLPQGALQQVEHLVALSVLGPNLNFDPRYWQGLSLQLAVSEVRALAAEGPSLGPAAQAPVSAAVVGQPRVASSAPRSGSASPLSPTPQLATSVAAATAGPSALARAQAEAEQRRQGGPAAAPPPPPRLQPEGPPVTWARLGDRIVARVPDGRLDATALRSLREGNWDCLSRGEQPLPQDAERWIADGAPFITEAPVLSRLFLDGAPLHKGRWDELSTERGGYRVLECQLPRVAPVLAIWVPESEGRPRRLIMVSEPAADPAAVHAAAG